MKAMTMLCLVLAVSAAASGQNSADAEKSKIIALENAWNLAEERKDVRALDELLGSKLVYIDYDGSIQNKEQFLESVRRPSLHPEQIVNESTTVYMYGATAVVTGTYREKGVDKGKAYLRRGRFTDTWIYGNGIWQCVASQSTLMGR
ncbi:MAG: nuclear transport factor 2 family protein [Terriglobales bacterium]